MSVALSSKLCFYCRIPIPAKQLKLLCKNCFDRLEEGKTRYRRVTRTPNFEVTIERVPLQEVPVKRKHSKHKKVP